MRFPFLMFVTLALFPLFAAPAMAGKYNPTLSIGDAAPAWKDLPGVDGKKHSLADLRDKHAVVVVFTCNSCPYAVDYEARLKDFVEQHCGPHAKTALVAINVNRVPEDSFEKMQARAEKQGFNFPYLYDETQQIARDFGASYTPEFFVLNKQRKVIYMGAMDDSPAAAQVTQLYVVPAVAAALQGKTPEVAETPAKGCAVRYVRRRNKSN